MTAKEYLRQVKTLDIKISRRIRERDSLKALALSTGSREASPDKVQSGVNLHKMEDAVAGYVDLEDEINRLIDVFADKKHLIISQIEGLDNPQHIECLGRRYVDYDSWEDIAADIPHSIMPPGPSGSGPIRIS